MNAERNEIAAFISNNGEQLYRYAQSTISPTLVTGDNRPLLPCCVGRHPHPTGAEEPSTTTVVASAAIRRLTDAEDTTTSCQQSTQTTRPTPQLLVVTRSRPTRRLLIVVVADACSFAACCCGRCLLFPVFTPIGWLCTIQAYTLVIFSLVKLECVGTLLRAHTPIRWLCKTQANILVFFSLVTLECVGTPWARSVGGRGRSWELRVAIVVVSVVTTIWS
jgi:hypothetical protein